MYFEIININFFGQYIVTMGNLYATPMIGNNTLGTKYAFACPEGSHIDRIKGTADTQVRGISFHCSDGVTKSPIYGSTAGTAWEDVSPSGYLGIGTTNAADTINRITFKRADGTFSKTFGGAGGTPIYNNITLGPAMRIGEADGSAGTALNSLRFMGRPSGAPVTPALEPPPVPCAKPIANSAATWAIAKKYYETSPGITGVFWMKPVAGNLVNSTTIDIAYGVYRSASLETVESTQTRRFIFTAPDSTCTWSVASMGAVGSGTTVIVPDVTPPPVVVTPPVITNPSPPVVVTPPVITNPPPVVTPPPASEMIASDQMGIIWVFIFFVMMIFMTAVILIRKRRAAILARQKNQS